MLNAILNLEKEPVFQNGYACIKIVIVKLLSHFQATVIRGTINNQILTNFDIYTGRLLHPDWIDSVRLNHSYYIH